ALLVVLELGKVREVDPHTGGELPLAEPALAALAANSGSERLEVQGLLQVDLRSGERRSGNQRSLGCWLPNRNTSYIAPGGPTAPGAWARPISSLTRRMLSRILNTEVELNYPNPTRSTRWMDRRPNDSSVGRRSSECRRPSRRWPPPSS